MALPVNDKDITVPEELVQEWQGIVDIMAAIIDVPAGLIMKVEPPGIEVFRASVSSGNPYKVGQKEHLRDSGLYCEWVVNNRAKLLVANALKDPEWDKNPDIKLGMISYLGFPLLWPDGQVFGTICVLDLKENGYSRTYEGLMLQFKELVEVHLDFLSKNRELEKAIIERKKAEDGLRERTAELEATNKELQAFSYSVSHDLRAPLRAIDGFSRVMLDDHSDKLDEEGRRVLNTIRDSAEDMAHLIDNLLSFSRLGRHEVKLLTIDMAGLVQETFRQLKSVVPERQVELTLDTIPSCRGDRAMLREVVRNLLANAIKFTRPRESAVIEVGARTERDQNVYYVRDNGVGFDMQYAEKLFGVFQRLHSTAEFEGTGVGLAIVQRVIHRHGGRVWARARVDQGATFYFTLPTAGGEA